MTRLLFSKAAPRGHRRTAMIAACAALSLAVFATACGGAGDETAQLPGPTSEPTSGPTEPALSPDPTEASQTSQPTSETTAVPPATEGATPEPDDPPASTTEPEPAPSATAVSDPTEFECQPVTVHGELHQQTPADSDGDGVLDTCEAPHGHPHETATEDTTAEPTTEPTSGAVEPTPRPTPKPTVDTTPEPVSAVGPDWLRDPTCRNVWRWWDGDEWTEAVANDGIRSADPIRNSDNLTPPVTANDERDCIGPDWLPDPTCRHSQRWWNGERWTDEVANDGARGTDPLLSGENPPPPVKGQTPDCSGYPLTAAELGCEAVSPPACEINDDGNPVALRLMAYDEIAATVAGGGSMRLNDLRPVSVSDSEALSYVTECLAEWPTYQFSQQELNQIVYYQNEFFAGVPVSICNSLWRLPVMAIDHLGADVQCVWDRFKAYYFHLEPRYSDYRYSFTGWAELCNSWLDPAPEARFLDKCISLLIRVSQPLYDALGLGNVTASCTFTAETYENHELLGRCGQLTSLNRLSRRFREFAEANNVEWDETQVLQEIPGRGLFFIC